MTYSLSTSPPAQRIEWMIDLQAHPDMIREVFYQVEEKTRASSHPCPEPPETGVQAEGRSPFGFSEEEARQAQTPPHGHEDNALRGCAHPQPGCPADGRKYCAATPAPIALSPP